MSEIKILLQAEIDNVEDIKQQLEGIGKDIKIDIDTKDASRQFREMAKSSKEQVSSIRSINKELADSDRLTRGQATTLTRIQNQEKKILNLKRQTRAMNPESEEYKKVVEQLDKATTTTQKWSSSLKDVSSADLKTMDANLKEIEASTKRVTDVTKAHRQALKENERIDTRAAKEQERIAKQAIREQKKNLGVVARGMEDTGRGLMRMSAPVIGLGAASAKMSMDFESSFAEVN